MRAFLLLFLSSLRAKYWLIPSVMALGSIGLAFGAVVLDRQVGAGWAEELRWFYANEPDGARALLSTIAGSMITVAGVTFSITTVALATTASTFGPRLIDNFMQDRGNQVTLGTFIGTFLFCILVLRTVRAADDQLESFVPHIGVITALVLTLCSLGVLIYFIHHITESIEISNVVARVGGRLLAQIDVLFPETLGEAARAGREIEPAPDARPSEVAARSAGYVQYIDVQGLMGHASRHDLRIDLARRPGDFVAADTVIAYVFAARPVRDDELAQIRETIVVGGYRSEAQDVHYLVDRLVEVAARALSPGMNDVFTAINAMDWLGAGLTKLATRELPTDARKDDAGRLRVVARSRTFEEVAGEVFDQLRPYVSKDRNAALHCIDMLGRVAQRTESRERRLVLREHLRAHYEAAAAHMQNPRDTEALEARLVEIEAELDGRTTPA